MWALRAGKDEERDEPVVEPVTNKVDRRVVTLMSRCSVHHDRKAWVEQGTHIVDEIWCDEAPLWEDIGLQVIGEIIDWQDVYMVRLAFPSISQKGSEDVQLRMRSARSVTFATESKTTRPLCLRT